MTTAARWALSRALSLLTFLTVASVGITHAAAAQSRVDGRVDDEQGRPVPHATVLVVGATASTCSPAAMRGQTSSWIPVGAP